MNSQTSTPITVVANNSNIHYADLWSEAQQLTIPELIKLTIICLMYARVFKLWSAISR